MDGGFLGCGLRWMRADAPLAPTIPAFAAAIDDQFRVD